MSTKMGFWRWALASIAVLIATGTAASARVIDPTGVTTDEPTAIVLYPKLKVDLNTCQGLLHTCSLTPTVSCIDDEDCQPDCVSGFCNLAPTVACSSRSDCPGAAVDTIVQLTNTSEFLTKVLCFYTNTNSHCSNSPTTICTDANFHDVCPLGGICVQGWQETDFHLTLTKRQPISWSVNTGLPSLPLATMPGQNGQLDSGNIPAVPEVPFTGELTCIEVDTSTELPTDRNDFKGEATTTKTILSAIDASKYNAIGIRAIEGRQDGDPSVLNIGGPDAEYGVFNDQVVPPRFAGCPNVLTLNHFFDNAEVSTHDEGVTGPVRSDLTIVPCQRDFLNQTANGVDITVQFLIFNEFEQRFSASTKVNCYKQVHLSDIDTRPGVSGDNFSIFSAGVQGTLTGMSRLRSVAGPDVDGYDGRGILALLTENWAAGTCGPPPATTAGYMPSAEELCASDADCGGTTTCNFPRTSTADANVQFQGSRLQGDRILIPTP